MELEAKKQNKAVPFCAAPRKPVVPTFHFASALSILKLVNWLPRESKRGAGLTHQICTVRELRNQKCPVHWGPEATWGQTPVSPKCFQTTSLCIQASCSPRGSQDMAHHHQRAQHDTEVQRQSLAAGRAKAGPGSRVLRGHRPSRAPGAGRLGFHLQLGTRWGWGASPQTAIKGWKAAEGGRQGGSQLAMKPCLMSHGYGQKN